MFLFQSCPDDKVIRFKKAVEYYSEASKPPHFPPQLGGCLSDCHLHFYQLWCVLWRLTGKSHNTSTQHNFCFWTFLVKTFHALNFPFVCFTVRPKHMGVPVAVLSPKVVNIPQASLPAQPGVRNEYSDHSEKLRVLQVSWVQRGCVSRLFASGPALVPRASRGAQFVSWLSRERPPRTKQQHSSWGETHTAVWEVLSHQPGPGWQPQPHGGCLFQHLLHVLVLRKWRELRHNCQVSWARHFLSFSGPFQQEAPRCSH